MAKTKRPSFGNVLNFQGSSSSKPPHLLRVGPFSADEALADIKKFDDSLLFQKLGALTALLTMEMEAAQTENVSVDRGMREYLAVLFDHFEEAMCAELLRDDKFIHAMMLFSVSLSMRQNIMEGYATDKPRGRRSASSGGSKKTASKAALTAAYELKITLKDTRPKVWRKVVVPGSFSLGKLHHVIQAAMGWTDSHLHGFEFRGERFSDPRQCNDPFVEQDENSVKLGELGLKKGSKLLYVYDFGDDWEHEVVVESVIADGPQRANCAGGAGHCPPEDCGGAYRYSELVARMNKPVDEDDDDFETLEWFRTAYPNNEFKIEFVNRQVGKIK